MPTRVTHADRFLKSARFIIPVGFLLVLIAVLAVIIGLIRSREADMLVLHTLEVQQAAQSVLIGVRDAESAKRSHLLSSAPEYLEAFDRAMEALPEKLDTLRGLTRQPGATDPHRGPWRADRRQGRRAQADLELDQRESAG